MFSICTSSTWLPDVVAIGQKREVCTTKFGKGTLTTTSKVTLSLDNRCRKDTRVSFDFRRHGDKTSSHVGKLLGHLIDKPLTYDGKKQRKIWVIELLQERARMPLSEVSALYTLSGLPKQSCSAFAEELGADRLLTISYVKLERGFRDGGLGSAAIQGFHAALKCLSKGYSFSGTAPLIPCAIDVPGKEDKEVREKHYKRIVAFYEKHGY